MLVISDIDIGKEGKKAGSSNMSCKKAGIALREFSGILARHKKGKGSQRRKETWARTVTGAGGVICQCQIQKTEYISKNASKKQSRHWSCTGNRRPRSEAEGNVISV